MEEEEVREYRRAMNNIEVHNFKKEEEEEEEEDETPFMKPITKFYQVGDLDYYCENL